MAPYADLRTEKGIQRREAKRGACSLDRAWLSAYDLPSLGRTSRVFSVLSDEIHSVLSLGEYQLFMMVEHDPTTTGIVTQAAFPRARTLAAAMNLGHRHPTTADGTPQVMTIDIAWTRVVGQAPRRELLSYKPDLRDMKPRDWELAEIMEVAARDMGEVFRLVDHHALDTNLVSKWDQLRALFCIDGIAGLSPQLTNATAADLGQTIAAGLRPRLVDYCRTAARSLGTTRMQIFQTLQHLIARRVMTLDLRLTKPLLEYRISELEFR